MNIILALAIGFPFVMVAGLILYASFSDNGRDFNGEYGEDL